LEFREKDSKPVKNIYARLGNKGPNFCYAGHLDVVPAGNLKDWTVNPFKPSVKKGYLIGRGANDMKSSIAAFVSAVSNFVANKRDFNGSISLLITGDEEGVAINGTKKVVEYLKKKKEKIDFCLVGEPTNPNKLGEMIKIGRRGSMTGRLTIIGIQGHVAYPNRANNPSTALVQILKELKEIKFDNGTKDFQPTNLEITKINIDNFADNVIPGLANAKFNIRFNNKHSSNSIKKKINKIIKKISNKNKSKFKIDYRVSGEAFLTKPNNTTYMIQDIIKKITKIKPKLSTTGGTSDARFIRKIAPCLEFGLVGKTMHKVDEAVSLSDLKRLTLIYSTILKNYFK
jgi:succinyl-diaminopimelate desuccinylase